MKVRIVIFDGVDEMDFVGPLEIFRRASRLRPDIDIALVTLETQREVNGAFGLRVVPDGRLDHAVDLLTVPGGGYIGRALQGVRAQIAEGKLPRKIAELNRQGAIVAGVCTGAMILSAAGVLDGRAAITHQDAVADLLETSAKVVQARVVDDGDIVTCGGVTSSIDLALWITERLWGAEFAAKIAQDVEHPRTADIYVSKPEVH